MTKQLDLNDYKQGIADLYNRRSQTLEQAKATWEGISRPPLAKYRNLSSKLSSERLVKAKAEFEAKLEALQTEQGVWDEVTTWYVLSRKPETGTLNSGESAA